MDERYVGGGAPRCPLELQSGKPNRPSSGGRAKHCSTPRAGRFCGQLTAWLFFAYGSEAMSVRWKGFFLENLAYLSPSSKSPFFRFLATYHIRFDSSFSLKKNPLN
ncbi:hypothetical protein NEPTK9_000807 [Candidatus Neptunochlamydia vexilliferae]|uniref:Uncharacterized protein n=1 Tax=Candidatus Neptunichlamydia vexilliferae TaxID=1651774 RepID=A0ABS0AYT0_9BACT|nr:hypothetical protein [Candidatus Neptunochlamydia vexilliferae]